MIGNDKQYILRSTGIKKAGPKKYTKDRTCTVVQETDNFIVVQFQNGIKDTILKNDLINEHITLIDMEGNEMGRTKITPELLLEEFIKLEYQRDIDNKTPIKDYAQKIALNIGAAPSTVITYFHKFNLGSMLTDHWAGSFVDVTDQIRQCAVCGKGFNPNTSFQVNCNSKCTEKSYNRSKSAKNKKLKESAEEFEPMEEVEQTVEEVKDQVEEEETEYKVPAAPEKMLIPCFTGRVSGLRYEIGNEITLGDKEGEFFLTFNKTETEAFIRELQEAVELC